MIIKKIFLRNIRSYEEQTINLDRGSILFSGDIGSGKTSVLLAIEFALFGLQPGQKGTSLLRNGKDEGEIILELEIDGKLIEIQRVLKRGKSITQSYCSITIDGYKKELSVTEIKNSILKLLNYPEEFAKKQDMLYKFTVYTPQEEMKQIILEDPVTRINTIRHIFGIDKYKTIIENVSIILSKIREEKKINEGLISILESAKIDLEKESNNLDSKKNELILIEKDFLKVKKEREKIELEKKEIEEKINEKNKLHQEIEKAKISILHKNSIISDNNKKIDLFKKQISEMEKVKFNQDNIKKIIEETDNLKKEKENLSEKKISLFSQLNAINLKINEDKKIIEKLSIIEICPTCLQDVNKNYKDNVLRRLNSDISSNNDKIKKIKKEIDEISNFIEEVNNRIIDNEKKMNELKMIELELKRIEDKKLIVETLLKENSMIEKDLEIINQQINVIKDSLNKLNKYDLLYETKLKDFNEKLSKEKNLEIKIIELNKEIEFINKNIEDAKNKIKKIEEIESKINYLAELENWISKKFVYLISFIEKNVMVKIKSEFTALFQKWVSILISESFNVSLEDDFTPIIEQQDYELDYSYLSGGERTAIALAYRLALNQVINSILSKIKTRDIIILDEPTDGFSESQLEKMREVFQEINVEQLIIVSHEQKIESFVEKVIKFRKEQNRTIIEN